MCGGKSFFTNKHRRDIIDIDHVREKFLKNEKKRMIYKKYEDAKDTFTMDKICSQAVVWYVKHYRTHKPTLVLCHRHEQMPQGVECLGTVKLSLLTHLYRALRRGYSKISAYIKVYESWCAIDVQPVRQSELTQTILRSLERINTMNDSKTYSAKGACYKNSEPITEEQKRSKLRDMFSKGFSPPFLRKTAPVFSGLNTSSVNYEWIASAKNLVTAFFSRQLGMLVSEDSKYDNQ